MFLAHTNDGNETVLGGVHVVGRLGQAAMAVAGAHRMRFTFAMQTQIRHQRRIHRIEHRDLDEVIDRLIEKPLFDQLQLQRLKKRKLGLKDQILRLESRLIPDIIA